MAQAKIMVLILYYALAGAMALTSITFINSFNILNQIFESFDCESTGSRDCDTNLNIYSIYVVLQIVTSVMISFTSVVALFISFNPKVCMKKTKEKLPWLCA